MTTAQVIETSVTVNHNSPIQDYVHLKDHSQPTYKMTPGFKSFTNSLLFTIYKLHCIHRLSKCIDLLYHETLPDISQ